MLEHHSGHNFAIFRRSGIIRTRQDRISLFRNPCYALGLRNRLGINLKTDANAAQGISMRRGIGKVRHLEVNQLWLQDKVRSGEIMVEKVGGKINISDALTKFPEGDSQRLHITGSFMRLVAGRHELAPATIEDDMGVLE